MVILPSSSYRASDFVAAGSQLGVDLVVASEAAPPFDMGDRYLRIDCSDTDAAVATIVAAGDTVRLDGVVAADDAGVVIAAKAGERLGLLANPEQAAAATRDKAEARRLLAAAEVPQPGWAELKAGSDPQKIAEELGYPLVVKPTSLAAGQGVIRVDRPEDLAATIRRVREITASQGQSPDRLVLEQFVSGEEVAVEGMIMGGELTVLALFDKPVEPSGDGFEETILVTPSRLPAVHQAEVSRVAAQAVRALGLTVGPVHIELMVSDDRVYVIEVAARSIGGLCSRSLDFGLMGTSLESLILRNAIGRDKPELHRTGKASGVLMIPIPSSGQLVAVDGVDRVRKIDGVTGVDISVRPGEMVAPPPEGGRYLGFVFARADDPESVEMALRTAMEEIEVVIQ